MGGETDDDDDGKLNVTVVGLGAMGGGIARSLLESTSTRTVTGYDKSEALVTALHREAAAAGKAAGVGAAAAAAADAAPPTSLDKAVSKDATDVTILVLVNEAQCDAVCFGKGDGGGGGGGGGGNKRNLSTLLRKGSCVVLCSTVSATWARSARDKFHTKGVRFVDCPISGGPARARSGDLTMMASGDEDSLACAMPVLQALGSEVHVILGGAGMGSTAKMVHQLLAGVHICCAAEALALAARAGVDVQQMYDIVNGAAGASWMFTDRGKRMVERGGPDDVRSALDIFVKDLDIVCSEAKSVQSPVPLASVALQQFVSGQSLGLGRCDDSQVVQVYEILSGQAEEKEKDGPQQQPQQPPPPPPPTSVDTAVDVGSDDAGGSVKRTAVIGIGAMGGGMARALLASSSTASVVGYDRSEALVSALHREAAAAGKAGAADAPPPKSLGEAIAQQDTDVAILMLVNEMQCDEVCFGGGEGGENLLGLLRKGSCVVLCSTVTATWARLARDKFHSKGLMFVDCPISGGPARARAGDLTMMASGDEDSLAFAMPLLKAGGREVHVIPGGAGMGSTVKMVHQLLAGVHICCAAEALALAAKAGIDVKQMYDIVNGAAGASWMFSDRGKRMIAKGEPDVMSALDIFVKDLDIVYSEAKAAKCPIPLASAALQQFISGQALNYGRKDDSQVVKVYEKVSKVLVAKQGASLLA